MNINKILYPILLLLVVLSSCDYESPLDKEQYKKTLYLIGASSNLVTKELAYSSEVQEGFITNVFYLIINSVLRVQNYHPGF